MTVLEVDGVAVEPITTALAVHARRVVDAAQTRARRDVTAQPITHVYVVVTVARLTRAAVAITWVAPVPRRAPVVNTLSHKRAQNPIIQERVS